MWETFQVEVVKVWLPPSKSICYFLVLVHVSVVISFWNVQVILFTRDPCHSQWSHLALLKDTEWVHFSVAGNMVLTTCTQTEEFLNFMIYLWEVKKYSILNSYSQGTQMQWSGKKKKKKNQNLFLGNSVWSVVLRPGTVADRCFTYCVWRSSGQAGTVSVHILLVWKLRV